MNIFIIGGTGLLGCAAAELLLREGHAVTSLALPPLPQGALMPPGMALSFGNYLEQSDEEIRAALRDCDCFIFAAGVDERVEFPAPVYESYQKYNIDPVTRWLTLAKESGVKNAVVLGSYFSYFAKEWPELSLTQHHPYIRSRIAQEEAALALADESFCVSVLELPYIFGTQPGRKPVWTILIEQLEGMGKMTMFPKGGTAMLTVRQVAQCIAGAAKRHTTGQDAPGMAYPIGYYNLSWRSFLTIVHAAMGQPKRRTFDIPKWTFQAYGLKLRADYKKRSIEPGIDPVGLAEIMCRETYVSRAPAQSLGATGDDLKSAISDSIRLSVEAAKGAELVEMKAE